MEYQQLPFEIEELNNQLRNEFGDDLAGNAIWRVSWSNDQTEKRMSKYTDNGLELLFPEVQLKKKYPWIKDRWILERLVVVPEVNKDELVEPQSYECMWKFETPDKKYPLKPSFVACKFVVDAVYAALGKVSLGPKYVDPEMQNPVEAKQKRVDELCEALFGDESSLLLRTVTGEAVAYTGPTPYRSDEK